MPRKNIEGLHHLNRNRRVWPEDVERSELFTILKSRTHARTFDKAIRLTDEIIENHLGRSGEYDWAKLASIFGEKGLASVKEANHVWYMCADASKQHPIVTKKMLGMFLMWRFSHTNGWVAYVQETGRYDEISEKEITVTCYIKRK